MHLTVGPNNLGGESPSVASTFVTRLPLTTAYTPYPPRIQQANLRRMNGTKSATEAQAAKFRMRMRSQL